MTMEQAGLELTPTTAYADDMQEQSPPEDPRNKEANRNRWETALVVTIAAVVLIVVATTVGVLVVRNQRPSTPSPPPTTPPPTASPTTAVLTNPQAQLDWIRQQLADIPSTANLLDVLPTDVEDLTLVKSAPPVTRAMAWLVDSDTVDESSNLWRRWALASVYFANGGGGWLISDNWLSSASHCDWYGVTCCGEDHLEQVSSTCFGEDEDELVFLQLSADNVTGALGPEWALFRELRFLDLSDNDLTGDFPSTMLGSLPELLVLWLHHNHLTGNVTADLRANGILNTALLQRNDITGNWPVELCFPNLKNFGIDCNQIRCPYEECCEPARYCYYEELPP